MPLAFVIDEHLRGALQQAIRQHSARGGLPIDAVEVGDPPDLPLGSADPVILQWAERQGRLLVSQDYKMPRHFAAHLQAGRHSPGVLLLLPGARLADIVAMLELIAHAGDPAVYCDQIHFIP